MVCELYLNKALHTHTHTHTLPGKGALSSLSLMQKPFSVGHSPPSFAPGDIRASYPVAIRIKLTTQFDVFLLLSF